MENHRARLPLSMWVLLAAFFVMMLSGFVRMISSIVNWYWLSYADVTPGPLYLVLSGGLWGLLNLGVLVWLWLRRSGFRLVGSTAGLVLALLYWIDRLLVMTFADRYANAVFAAVITILSLVYVIITLRPWKDLKEIRKPQ